MRLFRKRPSLPEPKHPHVYVERPGGRVVKDTVKEQAGQEGRKRTLPVRKLPA